MKEFFVMWYHAFGSDDRLIKQHAWALLVSFVSLIISILCLGYAL